MISKIISLENVLLRSITDVFHDLNELKNAGTFPLRRLEFASVRQPDIDSLKTHLRRQL